VALTNVTPNATQGLATRGEGVYEYKEGNTGHDGGDSECNFLEGAKPMV